MATRSFIGRCRAWLSATVAAACAAALMAGLIEGALHSYDVVPAFAAVGFSAWLSLPLALLLSILARLAWNAWDPRSRVSRWTEAELGAPRYVAWLITVTVTLSLLWRGTLFGFALTASLKRPSVHALAIALIVLVLVVALMIASVPLANVLTSIARRVASSCYRRWRITVFSPAIVTSLVGVVIAGSLTWLWYGPIRGRVGALQIDEMLFLWIFIATFAAAHLPAIRGRLVRRATLAALCALTAAAVATSLYVRTSQPFTMLDVWSSVPTAGRVIGVLHDFEEDRDLFASSIKPRSLPGESPRDIVLITVDTLRADRLKAYGGAAKMPNVDKLGEGGVVFDWAFAPSNNTRRSMSALALGLSPPRVRGRVAGWALRLDPRHVLLAERLRAAGYDTAGFFCCRSHFGSDHRLGLIRGLEQVVIHKGDEVLVEKALSWLQKRDKQQVGAKRKPLFLWLHLIDPHLWHDKSKHKPKKVVTATQRYDLVLTKLDRALAGFLRHVTGKARENNTLVVLTSDHGEGLGSHGIKYHSSSLFNSEVRVPLIVHGGGLKPRRVTEPVSLIDLAPTILELAGFAPPGMPEMDGVSLGPLLRGETAPPRPVFAYQIKDRSVEHSLRAVVARGFKLIVGPGKKKRLYQLEEDPREQANQAHKFADVIAELQALLGDRRKLDATPPF